jgi:hypothetical protein
MELVLPCLLAPTRMIQACVRKDVTAEWLQQKQNRYKVRPRRSSGFFLKKNPPCTLVATLR